MGVNDERTSTDSRIAAGRSALHKAFSWQTMMCGDRCRHWTAARAVIKAADRVDPFRTRAKEILKAVAVLRDLQKISTRIPQETGRQVDRALAYGRLADRLAAILDSDTAKAQSRRDERAQISR